jgi:hypothetical protein
VRRKLLIFLLVCLFLPVVSVRAQSGDEGINGEEPEIRIWQIKERQDTEAPWEKTEETEETAAAEKPPEPGKKNRRIKNRGFELSLVNINNAGFANSFIGTNDIFLNPFTILHNYRDIILHPIKTFKNPDGITFDPNDVFRDPIEINIDDFLSGFKFDFGAVIKPVSINFNRKDKWGFGIDIGNIEAMGIFSLPNEVIGLQETEEIKFGAGMAVFADVGIPVFFHADEVKVKFRPAVFVPLAYLEPNIKYSYVGSRIELNYDLRVYSSLGFQTDEDGNVNNVNFEGEATIWEILNNNLGYDFNLGFEYPLYPWLDIGIDFSNIPVPWLGAKLNHYVSIKGEMWADYGSIDIPGIISGDEELDIDSMYDISEPEIKTGSGASNAILRPFKAIAYGKYRPFETDYFTLIPAVGFSYSKVYPQPFAFEGGLNVCFDTKNSSILTLGLNYMDHKWKNSIDYTLNLRLIQLDLGIIFQSQKFVKSWQGAGFGLNMGLKFGW